MEPCTGTHPRGSLVASVARFAGVLAVALLAAIHVRGQIVTGTFANLAENSTGTYLALGDGVHSVRLSWSLQAANQGWFYGSGVNFSTNVQVATGITSISQISNAGNWGWVANQAGPGLDADANGGTPQFLVLWNVVDDYYGVLRIDDINGTALNASWWFQSTHSSADFSAAIPEPATCAAGCGFVSLLGVFYHRRRTARV